IPATTSALMALRLSGRLTVIQKACPRFSRITLLWSVMISLACFAHALANICSRMAVDRKRDLTLARSVWRFLHPDLVVVEGRAADRRDRLGAGQHVDTVAADMGLVRLDRFRDQHAAAQAVEQFCGKRRFAPDVAERHGIAVRNPERSRICGMDHHRRRAFTRDRRWRFVEAGIEEAAR